jgi:hypothetical protein
MSLDFRLFGCLPDEPPPRRIGRGGPRALVLPRCPGAPGLPPCLLAPTLKIAKPTRRIWQCWQPSASSRPGTTL